MNLMISRLLLPLVKVAEFMEISAFLKSQEISILVSRKEDQLLEGFLKKI